MVSVRHALGVEDSFLFASRNSNPILHHFFTPNKERKREEQRARKEVFLEISSKCNGGFCKQRSDPCVCVYCAQAKCISPNFCGATTREEENRRRQTLEYIFRRVSLIKRVLYLSLFHSLFVNACFITNVYVKCHVRIANRLVEDSYCRGGIVNTRGVCSRARSVRPNSPKALWRFRASTSNSPIGRSRPHTHTHLRYLY